MKMNEVFTIYESKHSNVVRIHATEGCGKGPRWWTETRRLSSEDKLIKLYFTRTDDLKRIVKRND